MWKTLILVLACAFANQSGASPQANPVLPVHDTEDFGQPEIAAYYRARIEKFYHVDFPPLDPDAP